MGALDKIEDREVYRILPIASTSGNSRLPGWQGLQDVPAF